MINQPLISVVIPLYNKRDAICKTLRSVAEQTYEHWECIIVDDGSTDDSRTFVQPFLEDERFVYKYKQNAGVSSARNYGVEISKGMYIVFLDADDFFLPRALELLSATCQRFNTRVAVGRTCSQVRGELRRSFTTLRSGIIHDNFREWALGNYSPRTGAAIFHRDILLRHPNRIDLSRFEDAESLCNIIREEKVAYTRNFVFVYCGEYANLSRILNFEKDFCSCLSFAGKSHWEKVLLGGILASGIEAYGYERMNKLYAPYMHYSKVLRLHHKVRHYFNKAVRLLEKIKILPVIK